MMMPLLCDTESMKGSLAETLTGGMDGTDNQSSGRSTNEIRTERLSKALQRMRKKSLSVCAIRDTGKINIKVDPPPEHSPKRLDQSCEDVTYLRVRTGSVPANPFELTTKPLAIAAKESNAPTNVLKFGQLPSAKTLNRFVKNLLHRREKDHWSQSPTVQVRKTAVITDPEKRRSTGSRQQSPGHTIRSSNRRSSCSMNSSNSSRCQSPLTYINMLNFSSMDEAQHTAGAVETYTIVIIGLDEVGREELIDLFLQLDEKKKKDDSETDTSNPLITIAVENKQAKLRFIEVNSEKNDLWHSLSADCYLAMYKNGQPESFRNAAQVLRKLRESNRQIPAFIVLNREASSLETKRQPNANDDGRQIAKQNDYNYYFEICTQTGYNIEELMTNVVRRIRTHVQQQYRHQCKSKFRGRSIESDTKSLTDQNRYTFANNWLQFRTGSADSNSSETSSKASPLHSLSMIRSKLWQKKRIQSGAGEAKLGISLVNLTSPSGFHKYFKFVCRRKSLSLENLASQLTVKKSQFK